MNFWDKLQYVDRRIIYTLLIIGVVTALINPMGLPISISGETEAFYDEINKLQPGDIFYMGMEFSTGGIPELRPAVVVSARLAFSRGAKIVTGAMWIEGAQIGATAVNEVAEEMGKEYGVDYVNLGYKPGGQVFLEKAAYDLWDAAAGVDNRGNSLSDLSLMSEVKSFEDVKLIGIYNTGNPGVQEYIKIVGDRLGVPLISSCVAVSIPEQMPFLQSGQLKGLLKGMRGAAEFEVMNKMPGPATAGMDAQSVAHVIIIVFMIIGNIGYFLGTQKKKSRLTSGR